MGRQVDEIEINGYKSIGSCKLELHSLNLLIGPNGAGKSNFISAFSLLGDVVEGRLQTAVAKAGSSSSILHGGPKRTERVTLRARFGVNEYETSLIPTADETLILEEEWVRFDGDLFDGWHGERIGSGNRESVLKERALDTPVAKYCHRAMKSWKVFHFHDTSPETGAKRKQQVGDNQFLRPDASNLAPFLYWMREARLDHYRRIVDTIRLIAPFFDDFMLVPDRLSEDQIQLEWRQVGSDQYFNGHSLSDGTLRFIALATLLLQPDPPSVVVIDEPELGLHPAAIVQLAALMRTASKRVQVVISTQSVTLLNQFELHETIVVEHGAQGSTFKRPDVTELEAWLDRYAIGELWEKNVLGGRP